MDFLRSELADKKEELRQLRSFLEAARESECRLKESAKELSESQAEVQFLKEEMKRQENIIQNLMASKAVAHTSANLTRGGKKSMPHHNDEKDVQESGKLNAVSAM